MIKLIFSFICYSCLIIRVVGLISFSVSVSLTRTHILTDVLAFGVLVLTRSPMPSVFLHSASVLFQVRAGTGLVRAQG